MPKSSEEFEEQCRKDITKDVNRHIKANPSACVGRFVDQKVLESTVLSQYGRFNTAMRKADYDERTLSSKGARQQSVWNDRVNMLSVPLNMSVEQAYFDLHGTGMNGRRPDPMHQAVYCKHCGAKYHGDPACMDLYCPVCHHKTQWGELVLDDRILSR